MLSPDDKEVISKLATENLETAQKLDSLTFKFWLLCILLFSACQQLFGLLDQFSIC